jgi:replication factor C small subunit
LEECDGLTLEAWKALRATIEKYHKTVRFIANCNYIDKIPDPIKSRFNVIVIDPINNDEEQYLFNCYLERIKYILDYFKITYTQDNIISFVKSNFPDMRALITKIQQLYNRGCSELTKDMLANSYDCSELFKLIISKPDPVSNYKQLVSEWSTKPDEAILAIGKEFPDYIMTIKPELVNKLPLILINTAEYNAMLSQSIDKFVTLLGLVFKLQIILNNQC